MTSAAVEDRSKVPDAGLRSGSSPPPKPPHPSDCPRTVRHVTGTSHDIPPDRGEVSARHRLMND